jgi:hypothetical protein
MPRLDPEKAAVIEGWAMAWPPLPPLPPGEYVGTLTRLTVCTSQYHRGCSWDRVFDVRHLHLAGL